MVTCIKLTLHNVNVFTKTRRINPNKNKILNKYPNIKKEILEVTSFLYGNNITIKERLFCILHDVTTQQTCLNCNIPLRLPHDKTTYPQYCSKKCSANCSIKQQKTKQTNTELYGVSHFSKTETARKRQSEMWEKLTPTEITQRIEKRKRTCVKYYGVEDPMKNQSIINKRRITNQARYNVNYVSQNNIVKNKIKTNHAKKITYSIKHLIDENQSKTILQIAAEYNTSPSFISSVFKRYNIKPKIHYSSSPQNEIFTFIKENTNLNVLKNDRTVLPHNGELDIIIPESNLAIELNGIYWHSELNGKLRNYHNKKTLHCNENNIKLLQIYDIEWYQQQEIVKSRILNCIQQTSTTIYARKCTVQRINNTTTNKFFNENHIQKYAPSSYNFGLYYENKLVALMSFCKSRFNKNYKYELLRFANLLNVRVIGGASKLLNHAIKKLQTSQIISYSDRRWSTGNLYNKLKFTHLRTANPNYWYFSRSDTTKLFHRTNFQKHKLKNKLENFNPKLSEWENMKVHNFDRIWDCGNDVWILND